MLFFFFFWFLSLSKGFPFIVFNVADSASKFMRTVQQKVFTFQTTDYRLVRRDSRKSTDLGLNSLLQASLVSHCLYFEVGKVLPTFLL